MRMHGMPRFSMDWDVFIPGRDASNLALINGVLKDLLDVPLLALGKRGENFVQTYQLRSGILQFHLGLPGIPSFDEAETHAVQIEIENGIKVKCCGGTDLLASKEAANRDVDQADIEFLQKKKELNVLD